MTAPRTDQLLIFRFFQCDFRSQRFHAKARIEECQSSRHAGSALICWPAGAGYRHVAHVRVITQCKQRTILFRGAHSIVRMRQRAGGPAWEGVCPSPLVAVAIAPAASSMPAASFRPYPAPPADLEDLLHAPVANVAVHRNDGGVSHLPMFAVHRKNCSVFHSVQHDSASAEAGR